MIGTMLRTCARLLLLSTVALPASAGPLGRESVPDALKPWIPWALHGAEERQCPYFYNSNEQRQCAWPSQLALAVTGKGGSFSFQVSAFRALWMPLPGDSKHWPQDIRVDGKPAVVVGQGERPGVEISAGAHIISGSFAWNELPESLLLPDAIGLVALTSNGNRVALPNLDGWGRLWLKRQAERSEGAERVEIRVNRLVTDDIPLTLSTRIELTASGKNQELLVPNVLLSGFVPLSLTSLLPARFEPDGRLRVQVRPGRWQLLAAARNMAPQSALTLPKTSDRLAPPEEVWAFEARPALRLANVEGVPSVDPQQTTLPQEWKSFPAFLMKPGDSMRLHQTKRGDPEPEPDRLALARSIWLDFDGRGYTVQDQISGTITRAWRLELASPQTPGRIAVDGIDQYITRLGADNAPGVELRRGTAHIVADSRIESGGRTLSATGWLQDFNQLSATLHLPPGWRLLHASGVDRAPQAWIERWTLLDFFLVLIVTLAAGRLFGWRWGVAVLIALTLSYHERGAPTWTWLNLLAAVALLRVLREGRLRKWVAGYRWLALLGVTLLLIPFAVDQVREALYPVLEHRWQAIGDQAARYDQAGVVAGMAQNQPVPAAAPAPPPAAMPEKEAEPPEQRARPEPKALPRAGKLKQEAPSVESRYYSDSMARSSLDQIDPNAKVQTGPGLPQWSWNDYQLIWSGPVEHTQAMHLWLLSPAGAKLATLLRLALLVALLARLASTGPIRLPHLRAGSAAVLLATFALLVSAPGGRALAQSTPDPDMLDELRDKLLAPPDCLPNCAEISRLKLTAAGNSLQVRLEAHAAADTALPLPGGASSWLPERVSVDGAPARGLMRRAGSLWVQLAKGVHQIAMESNLAERPSVQLALPLRPHRVEASLSGWTLDGLGDGGEPGESLLLSRVAGKGRAAQAEAGETLPPFLRVERILNLGLTWDATTRVVRAGASSAPVLVKVPLLEGESVTRSEVRVQDGVAMVNLGPQTSEFSFGSALKESARLALVAPSDSSQIQVWRLNLGSQWHVQLSGIPVIHQQDESGRWLPEWRPWPGEQVALALTKPAGMPGQTLTLDRSVLTLSPGIRATDADLRLSLRSSRGGQHAVQLPEGAVLQSVAINGQTQPIRLEGRALSLPVTPGAQQIDIAWREPRGVSMMFAGSPVDTGTAGVNGALHLKLPEGRWLLFTGGPAMGPAILFWGVVIVLVPIAVALGRIRLTPLKAYEWFLLALGLTQAPMLTAVIVAGWLLALGVRRRFGEAYSSNRWFNFGQVLLALLTIAAIVSLFWAVENGLLGYPEMQVAGNGSDLWNLHWYQDRTRAALPSAWVVSVPMMVYRLLMLAWALWLAYALLKWLRWAWECFSDHGYWRRLELWKKPTAAPKGSAASEGSEESKL